MASPSEPRSRAGTTNSRLLPNIAKPASRLMIENSKKTFTVMKPTSTGNHITIMRASKLIANSSSDYMFDMPSPPLPPVGSCELRRGAGGDVSLNTQSTAGITSETRPMELVIPRRMKPMSRKALTEKPMMEMTNSAVLGSKSANLLSPEMIPVTPMMSKNMSELETSGIGSPLNKSAQKKSRKGSNTKRNRSVKK
jgi:hypothetical protein